MRALLLFLIVIGSLPVILMKPHIGILMWSWISYMNPHRISWGITDNMQLAQIIGITTLAGWLLSREPKRLPMTSVTVLMAAYALWISLTTLFALNPDDAYAKWEQTTKILLMTFVTMSLMLSRERIHALVWVIAVSIGFYGIKGGLFTIVTGGEFRVWGPPDSFIRDNNAIALALVLTVPLMRYLQLTTGYWYVRWGLWGAISLSLLAILGTYSRGGLLALAAMVATLLIKSRRKFLMLCFVVPVLVFGFHFVPEQWWERMQTIKTYEEDVSAQGRLYAWGFALEVAADRPLVGGGFNVFWSHDIWRKYNPYAPEDDLGKGAHSIYFEVLGEHGYIGLVLFLLLGIAGLATGTWVIRRSRDRPDLLWARDLATMTQVALIAYAVAGTFQNLATFDLYYHLLAIMAVTRQVVADRLSAEPTAQTTLVERRVGQPAPLR